MPGIINCPDKRKMLKIRSWIWCDIEMCLFNSYCSHSPNELILCLDVWACLANCGLSPSLGLLSTSVFSPRGLVTTMDVSGVTKLYFSDSSKASFFTVSFSRSGNCSLCHELFIYVSNMCFNIPSLCICQILLVICQRNFSYKWEACFFTSLWTRRPVVSNIINLVPFLLQTS